MSFSVSGYYTVQSVSQPFQPGTPYYILQLVPGETIAYTMSMTATNDDPFAQEELSISTAPDAPDPDSVLLDELSYLSGSTESGVITVSSGSDFNVEEPTPGQWDVTVSSSYDPDAPYYLVFATFPGSSARESEYVGGINLAVTPSPTSAAPLQPPAPPPKLTSEEKAALSEAADALDRLSHALDVLNVNGSYQTIALSVANWGASSAASQLSPGVGFVNSIVQTALATASTALELSEEEVNPVVLTLGVGSVIDGIASLILTLLAKDPADANYGTVFVSPLTPITISNGSTTDQAFINDSYAVLNDYLNALVADERYQGAELAGNTADQTMQETAYNAAMAEAGTDTANLSKDLTALSAELSSNGVADQDLSSEAGSLAAVQAHLQNVGTTDTFLSFLATQEGVTSADITNIIGSIEALTAPSLSGSAYAGIANASTALMTLAESAACYRRGTRLLTDKGEIAVEDLKTGDRLITLSGKSEPIKWIGHRDVNCERHPNPADVWPIVVRAGAFDPDMPCRDLWLSPGHNVVSEGVLIPISALVNGRTIEQVQHSSVEYWHVELDAHDIILADGLPAESYLDTGNRCAFINGGDFIEQHPGFGPKHWPETCLPLIHEGNQLARAKKSLLERAGALGYGITAEDDLHIVADGKRIEPVRLNGTRRFFALPDGSEDVMLRSRTFVPAHVNPDSADGRDLGICVGRLQIDGEDLALDRDEAFARGWHHVEHYPNNVQQRWTTGATPLPAGCRLIVIDIAGDGYYWYERRDNIIALFGIRGSADALTA